MSALDILEIQIMPVKPKDGLIAFVSFVINNQFYIGNVALYTSPFSLDGFRLVYPIKVLPNGKEIHCVHPINKETGSVIQKRVVEEYLKLIEKLAKGDVKNGEKQYAA